MENEDLNFNTRIDLSSIIDNINLIKQEISKVLIGQDQMVDLILTAMLSDGHVLIEGVPGVAKTLTAKLISNVIDSKFGRIQFTPDLMPSDVLGTSVYNPKTTAFDFKKGPIFKNLVLIDEINRAPAKTQAALFEVMEEKQITMDGTKYKMNPPFIVLATQNPVEHEGTYKLPEAQLDRFLFKINVDYPNKDNEINIIKSKVKSSFKDDNLDIKKVISGEQLLEMKQIVNQVLIDDVLVKYVVDIIQLTRNHPSIYLGASPRAGIFLVHAAQSFAVLNGRDFVTPDDIQFLAPHLLRHRIILTPEKEMEGVTEDEVTTELLKEVEVPR